MGNRKKTIMGIMLILVLFALPGFAVNKNVRINLRAIALIESGGDPLAYSPHEQAYGLFQIRAPALLDYNTAGPGRACPLILTDMYDPFLAEAVASWYFDTAIPAYLAYYRIADTVENRIIAWNAGIGAMAEGRRVPATTQAYINIYKEMTK